MKHPHIQFYTGDWLKAPDLRRCSFAAKGMWIDLLCLMHECEERGRLASKGVPWTDAEIIQAVGGDQHFASTLLDELIAKGVADRDSDGAVICRRMRREAHLQSARACAGSKGGSKTQANRVANGVANTQANSDSDIDIDTALMERGAGENQPDPQPDPFDRFWGAYPRRVGKAAARRLWGRLKLDPAIDRVLAAVALQAASEQWRKKGGRYIPHPATWLNQGRWEDEPLKPAADRFREQADNQVQQRRERERQAAADAERSRREMDAALEGQDLDALKAAVVKNNKHLAGMDPARNPILRAAMVAELRRSP